MGTLLHLTILRCLGASVIAELVSELLRAHLTALPDPNGITAAAELCDTVKVSSKSAHGVARSVFFRCRERARASV